MAARPSARCRPAPRRRSRRPSDSTPNTLAAVLFGRIDHIGVAVEDLDAALELYARDFDMREQHRETVEEQGVEAVLLEVGEGHVELIKPLGPETGVGKFIAKNGPGLHHVAYATDDIDSALGAVREAGLKLIDKE